MNILANKGCPAAKKENNGSVKDKTIELFLSFNTIKLTRTINLKGSKIENGISVIWDRVGIKYTKANMTISSDTVGKTLCFKTASLIFKELFYQIQVFYQLYTSNLHQ